jgi:putative tryptophan/tyrosine transport system substrate-binding protein
MRRRAFILTLAGAAAWPLAARAQQPVPLIGYLATGFGDNFSAPGLAAFRQGLKESGYVEGVDVIVEYRWAEGRYDRLPRLAADLVARQVAMVAALSGPAALAAKSTTATTPIVFMSGSDPVSYGLVASLNRPGGNATGVYFFTESLENKRMELLRDLFPNGHLLGVLLNPTLGRAVGSAEPQSMARQEAARALGFELRDIAASNEAELISAFADAAAQRVAALLVSTDPFFLNQREQIIALAARHAVPALYGFREFPAAGGLMSYAPSLSEAVRLVGIYGGRILKGEKPADLPVQQSTKIELVINFKTAKSLGLEIPPTLLARADEVIE